MSNNTISRNLPRGYCMTNKLEIGGFTYYLRDKELEFWELFKRGDLYLSSTFFLVFFEFYFYYLCLSLGIPMGKESLKFAMYYASTLKL